MRGQCVVTISRAGAEALRDFAAVMPYAVDQISQGTDEFRSACTGFAHGFGELEESFQQVVAICVNAAQVAAESIEEFPANLIATADEIDRYLDDHPEIDAAASGESGTRRGPRVFDTKVTTRRR